MTNFPVGLTMKFSSKLLLGEELLVLGVEHRFEDVLLQRSFRIICSPASSRCCVEMRTLRSRRDGRSRSGRDLRLAVGTEIGNHRGLANVGELRAS